MICDSLKWLGLDWDEGPIAGDPMGHTAKASVVTSTGNMRKNFSTKAMLIVAFAPAKSLAKFVPHSAPQVSAIGVRWTRKRFK